MKIRICLMAFVVAMFTASLTQAAEPFFSFEPADKTGRVPQSFQGWHSQFEDDNDYGESWFFLAHANDGGVLFAMLSITNLGLRTFDGRLDAQYYDADGTPYRFHKELKRDSVKALKDKMDVTVGKSRAWGGGSSYNISIDYPEFKMQMNIKNKLPSLIVGDGSVKFFKDKSSEWTLGMNVPRGTTSGKLTVKGKSFDLAGNGYHDHGWSTIKMPDIMSKWYSLRLYGEKYSIIFHQQTMSKKFGKKSHKLGVFGVDGKMIAPIRHFTFTPTEWEKHKAGYKIPLAFDVALKAGGYDVKGTVRMDTFLDAIDVLGQVSWPIRIVIKAFYSNPYMYRYVGAYELDITAPDGSKEHISGKSVIESNYF